MRDHKTRKSPLFQSARASKARINPVATAAPTLDHAQLTCFPPVSPRFAGSAGSRCRSWLGLASPQRRPRAISAPPTHDSSDEPQNCFQKQPEWVSHSRTSAAALRLKIRLLHVAPLHKRVMQWSCPTRGCERKLRENIFPTTEDTGLSGPARNASTALQLLEYPPEQRLVCVPFQHTQPERTQVMEFSRKPIGRATG